ncbi:T9SS type A sorting domain-containing protein [Mangrovimonas sp. TPBH4]|uniref:T9SS type A sorting domain-containing protein n=1 Tax=Mangrovimonas sp. TPBH4 TaxID=1645914 RepID=UPI0006B59E38|nr:T9SS type A sorting domain-containing protein [Mangrovimonas sp. TPBH4]
MKKTTFLWTIYFFLLTFFANAQISIGDGVGTTSQLPVSSCYNYSYSQQIIYQTEINSIGEITSLSFYFNSSAGENSNSSDWTIYLGHTAKSAFSSATDWEIIDNLTQVFSGTVSYPGNGNWIEIVLDTPFNYNNADNLLIAVDENELDYDCANSCRMTSATSYRSLYYETDGANPDPSTFNGSGNLVAGYTNVILGGLEMSLPPICDAVLTAPLDGASGVSLLTNLTWTEASGDPEGYLLSVGITSGGAEILDSYDVGNVLSYNLDLQEGTTYYVTITPYNANGNATGCSEASFTTASLPACPELTADLDECGNYDFEVTWEDVAGAEGYYVTLGTTSGGNDLANNEDNGLSTSYTVSSVGPNTTYYASVIAYNSVGQSTGCAEGEFTTNSSVCYCESNPVSVDNDGIGSLNVGDTLYESTGDNSYEDFTNIAAELSQDTMADIEIEFLTTWAYNVNLWIDLNDDLEFDASELFFTGSSNFEPVSIVDASFMMPEDASLGEHRMRIVSAYSEENASNPCNNNAKSVTVDVTVNIVEGSCLPPQGSAEVVPDCNNNQFFIAIDITDLGNGNPNITDGTLTWTILGLGTTQIGPFANGDSKTLILRHGEDASCNTNLGTLNFYCPPSNDDCDSALMVTHQLNVLDASTASATNGTLQGATDSGVEAPECDSLQGTANDDIWYSFVAETSEVNITLEDNFNGIVELLEGTCGALEHISCKDIGQNPEIMEFDLIQGNTYYVRVYSYSEAVETVPTFSLKVWSSSTLSIEDKESEGMFQYYPNPVENVLTLKAGSNIENVTVFDMIGKEVLRLNPAKIESNIDMTMLPSGAYFIQVSIDNVVKTIRIVKQ